MIRRRPVGDAVDHFLLILLDGGDQFGFVLFGELAEGFVEQALGGGGVALETADHVGREARMGFDDGERSLRLVGEDAEGAGQAVLGRVPAGGGLAPLARLG